MPTVKVNLASAEGQRDFSPIPDADYHFMVTNVKHDQVKNGPNKGAARLNWEFTVQDGKYADRKVFDGHNLVANQLWKPKALLSAVGVEIPEGEFEFDPEDVVGEEFIGRVVTQKGDEKEDGSKYPDRNQIKSFHPYEASDEDLIQ